MLDVGTEAPNFFLPGSHRGDIGEFALADYLGEDIVVLAFYPADFSPTCTDEMCAIRDIDVLDLDEDVTVLAIGPDTAWSHRAFAEKYAIDFPLLSDTNGDVAEEYDVLLENWEGHERIPQRSAFVIDDRGRIRYSWCTEDQSVLPNLREIRSAIDEIQDDRTAAERYGNGFESYDRGAKAFEEARRAFERSEWTTAETTFRTASETLEDAESAFASARRFAESESVRETAAKALQRAKALRKAAKWYAKAAEESPAGDEERIAKYRSEAQMHREAARRIEAPCDPEALVAETDSEL